MEKAFACLKSDPSPVQTDTATASVRVFLPPADRAVFGIKRTILVQGASSGLKAPRHPAPLHPSALPTL